MDKLQVLLSKGYFPKELPPPFTTHLFGVHSREILSEWVKNATLTADNARFRRLGKIEETEPELYSLPKSPHERRYLHLINPVPQLLLSAILVRNWSTVAHWLERQRFSFSRTTISLNGDRAVDEPDFQSNAVHKQLIKASYDFEIRSDVTRFYPSIYTHSIPWAAYGKEKVKADRRSFDSSLAARIDTLLRKCNRGQSVGIPIGPDTSRIVADIVSGYVDRRVASKTGLSRGAADRLQDDWIIGCQTVEEAQNLLSALRVAYLELGLEIHGGKTSITGITDNTGTPWLHTLQVAAKIAPNLSGANLQHFCEVALDLQKQYPSDRPLRYGLTLLHSRSIRPADIPYLQAFLMRALMIDSRNIDVVSAILINMRRDGRNIYDNLISKRINSIIRNGLERGEHFEVSWGIFLLKGLALPVYLNDARELLIKIESPVICLLLLDMNSRGLAKSLPLSRWEDRISKATMDGPDWLLAYEGVRHGWLKDKKGNIRNHSMLKPMFDRGIKFYDENKNVPTTTKALKIRWSTRKRRFSDAMIWRLIVSKYI